MGDVASFGKGLAFNVQTATMEKLFAYLRQYAADDDELMRLASDEKYNEACGGWLFGHLSLPALLHLRGVVAQLEAELPGALYDWYEESKPLFYENMKEFKEKLTVRIEQLRKEQG